jgi:hypothetical protein
MNKKEVKRLASLVSKSTQKEAMLSYLTEGKEISSTGAWDAGIADPRRVINQLRKAGHRINGNVQVGRTVYALAPARKTVRKAK